MEAAKILSKRPCLIILLFLLMLISFSSSRVHAENGANVNFNDILNSVDYNKIEKHIEVLSSLGSRVTGYNGCEAAADYIAKIFLSYGLKVSRQEYPVVVPKDHGASVILLDEKGEEVKTINAYAIWPNLIQTSMIPSETRFEGPLIYVGEGKLADFDGKNVMGAIVLMRFNSENNWINAAKLGAKAVIFIAPTETSYIEVRSKFLRTPIYFPRLYISNQDGTELQKAAESENLTVRLQSGMKYEEVKAENIIGVIPGKDNPEDIIVVAAHYDTWSVVPLLAPGRDEATSIASLLELARYFSNNPPKKTIWFVALSGHYQALAGARWFTEKYFFGGEKIWFFVGLDFSTDGNEVAMLYRGHMYDFGGGGVVLRWTSWLGRRIFSTYIPSLEKQKMKSYNVQDGFTGFTYGWWGSIPVPYMLDSEPFAIAHGIGFTIRTNGVRRLHWGNPLSTEVKIENLKPQLEVASAVIYGLANENEPFSSLTSFSEPERYLFTAAGGDLAGFLTVQGRVRYYNLSIGWYTDFPNALVVVQRIDKSFASYPFSTIIEISNGTGRFTVIGASGYGYGHGYGIVDQWNFEAFHINEKTGFIDYAPDYGQYGRAVVQFSYSLNTQPYSVTTILFKCSSAVLFDVVDPVSFRPKLFFDPRFKNAMHSWSPSTTVSGGGGWWSPTISVSGRWSFIIYDFATLSEYIMWGFYSVGYEDLAMVFVPPDTRFMVIYRSGAQAPIVGLLTNSTSEKPQGSGYLIKSNEELKIPITAYRFINDIYFLSQDRYAKLKSSSLRNPIAERNFMELEKHLKKAEKALSELRYDDAYSELTLAWGWAIQSYNETMGVIFDAVDINVIFFSLFFLFVFFFERMVFQSSGRKRWIIIAILFAALLGAYWYLHPAPKIAVNPAMSPLSVAILMLFIFVSTLLIDRMKRILREERTKIMGKHYAERATVPLVIMSFSYAPRNMRRRKTRTILVLSTVLTVTFALIAFTSVLPTLEVKFAHLPELPATYQGVLFKAEMTQTPDNILEPSIIGAIKAAAPNVTIATRVWCYPQLVGTEQVYQIIKSSSGSARIRAVLGLSPNELDIYMKAIRGRWIIESDKYVCLLSNQLAKRLNVDIGDNVQYGDLTLKVIGTYNEEQFNLIKDLDNYAITPANPNMVSALAAGRPIEGEQQVVPLSWEEIIVVPNKLAYDLGGYLASVAVISDNDEVIKQISNTFALTIQGIRMYMSLDGKVYVPSPVGWFGTQGFGFILAPLIIGCFTLFNTIITGVKERAREIFVYSSVGLSPKGVTLIFFAESLVYALTAGTLGYLLGIAANVIFVRSGYLPENFISNTSSLATMITIFISIISILLATLYPAFTASKMITPSLERKWKIPTKPRGDEWTVPLPFQMDTQEEVYGLMMYINEYFSAYTVESGQPFIVKDVKVFPEKLRVEVFMTLLPIESGVTQEFVIEAKVPEEENRWFFNLYIHRLSGVKELWIAVNRTIIDIIRKQILLWGSLPESERMKYMKGTAERKMEE